MAKTDWKIYEIQHRRGPDAPLKTRYQFTDGQGRRRHFATKAKAIEAVKYKALYHQEGRLATGLSDAIIRNAHQVAEEMGNSVAIVRRHYDAVLEPSKAIAWWEIQPKESGNVVPMKAVA
jgi:hypothetical protein